MKNNTLQNDIIADAYYLIKLFNNDNKEVTQMHIQKLMYLFEAYYMNVKNTDKLYGCDYQAWNFGAVATPLYKNFKKYGKDSITLNKDERKKADGIGSEKKKLLDEIYKVFGSFRTIDLYKFTNADNTPWRLAFDKGEYSIIDKQKLKDWFSKYVKKV